MFPSFVKVSVNLEAARELSRFFHNYIPEYFLSWFVILDTFRKYHCNLKCSYILLFFHSNPTMFEQAVKKRAARRYSI